MEIQIPSGVLYIVIENKKADKNNVSLAKHVTKRVT